MKFKIGDRVALKESYYGYKKGAQGKVVDVSGTYLGIRFKEASPFAHTCYGRTEPDHGLWVNPKMLEKIAGPQIVIYQDGNTVVAKNIGSKKTAEARCSPEDVFDFTFGARLALDRLLGTEKTEETPKKLNCRFVVVDKDIFEDSLTVGKIYEVKDGKFKNDDGNIFPLFEDLYIFERLQNYMTTDYSHGSVKIIKIFEDEVC